MQDVRLSLDLEPVAAAELLSPSWRLIRSAWTWCDDREGSCVSPPHKEGRHNGRSPLATTCCLCLMYIQAGTITGRALGSIVGRNLASYTAELGGKVSQASRSFESR